MSKAWIPSLSYVPHGTRSIRTSSDLSLPLQSHSLSRSPLQLFPLPFNMLSITNKCIPQRLLLGSVYESWASPAASHRPPSPQSYSCYCQSSRQYVSDEHIANHPNRHLYLYWIYRATSSCPSTVRHGWSRRRCGHQGRLGFC
jgi:hypothetical protein